jgi:hypothetical protein
MNTIVERTWIIPFEKKSFLTIEFSSLTEKKMANKIDRIMPL